jgi:putative membrane protein
MKSVFHLALVLAALLSLSVRGEDAALADNPAPPVAGGKLPQDASFLSAAHQENLALIRAGKLAEQHAQKATTFRFAVRVIIDQEKLDTQLSQIAAHENFPLSPELDVEHLAVLTRLESYADPSFDRAFLDAMQLEVQQAITLYQAAENAEKDPNTKTFFTNALTVLRSHLTLVQEAQQRLPEQQGFKTGSSIGR